MVDQCPFHEPRFPEALRDVSSKNLDGVSDLVVWAPIREGFIDAFANVSYETRLRTVAEALNDVRKNVREYREIEPFADIAQRILSLLNFRIGIVDRDIYGFGRLCEEDGKALRPRKYMYLTASFNGAWEPYMRLIWRPLGAFLDLILCNCDGYKSARDHEFEEFVQWVRDNSLDTANFNTVSGLTVKDQIYLEELEKIQREKNPDIANIDIAKLVVRHPDDLATAIRDDRANFGKVLELGLEALNVLFKLTSFYPPDIQRDGDGEYLHVATHELLQHISFDQRIAHLKQLGSADKEKAEVLEATFEHQLAWYRMDYPGGNRKRAKNPDFERTQVQKGLLSSYNDGLYTPITNGAILLLRISEPEKAKSFLHPDLWSWEDDNHPFFRNFSITYQGLEKLPLTKKELRAFPKEFRQGMEVRAPLIGDMYSNHPLNWNLPERNWPYQANHNRPPVSLHEVDLIVQLRVSITNPEDQGFIRFEQASASGRTDQDQISEPQETLSSKLKQSKSEWVSNIAKSKKHSKEQLNQAADFFEKLACELNKRKNKTCEFTGTAETIPAYIADLDALKDVLGVEILSIQSTNHADAARGHFGFVDGLSQPKIDDKLHYTDWLKQQRKNPNRKPMDIARGDLLLGYSNMLDDAATQNSDKKIQRNGSFLAIRKMSQDVKAFEEFGIRHQDRYDPAALAAKMMGRTFDGLPLITPAIGNDFDYEDDQEGMQCPFSSHIRRANPRNVVQDRKSPKIVRRGMSYGPRYNEDPKEDRGIMFIAYCANLGEQYETVQRWVNGGNSTNIASAHFDPILAPHSREKAPRTFRFASKSVCKNTGREKVKVYRFERDKPFVALEWGSYAFVPSKCFLKTIIERSDHEGDLLDRVERGRQVFEEVEALPSDNLKRKQWKILLEDFLVKDPSKHDISPDLWAYLQAKHKGVYRINSGVEGQNKRESEQPVLLVLDEKYILQVLKDSGTFSSKESLRRITKIFKRHHIGMDPADPDYLEESKVPNTVFHGYSEQTAYNLAYGISTAYLDKRKDIVKNVLGQNKFKLELTREFIAPVLAELSRKWFGIPDKTHFKSGSWAWDLVVGVKRPTQVPGDFWAPSRGAFYPRPTTTITNYAERHGKRLRDGIDKLVHEWRANGVQGKLSHEMYKRQPDFELLGRNVIGSMIGMLPPMAGNLRGIFYEWIDESLLWPLQGRLLSQKAKCGGPINYTMAKEVLRGKCGAIEMAMAKRPSPELLYRTATTGGTLGNVEFKKDDLVILSLVAATQKSLREKNTNIDLLFGGHREKGPENPDGNPHACSAQKMVMGATTGILAAFLEVGQIKAQPASLILEISGW